MLYDGSSWKRRVPNALLKMKENRYLNSWKNTRRIFNAQGRLLNASPEMNLFLLPSRG